MQQRILGFHVRLTVRRLMLVVLGAGLCMAAVEFARRARRPRPPLPWPWVSAGTILPTSPRLWVNGEDLRRGIRPPHTKWVYADGRVEDAPGVAVPRRLLDNPPPASPAPPGTKFDLGLWPPPTLSRDQTTHLLDVDRTKKGKRTKSEHN